jgi:hypothetical protein
VDVRAAQGEVNGLHRCQRYRKPRR